jgi:hypothetical protein
LADWMISGRKRFEIPVPRHIPLFYNWENIRFLRIGNWHFQYSLCSHFCRNRFLRLSCLKYLCLNSVF